MDIWAQFLRRLFSEVLRLRVGTFRSEIRTCWKTCSPSLALMAGQSGKSMSWIQELFQMVAETTSAKRHYLNIINHLAPVARDISQRCRRSSIKRNWLKAFDRHRNLAQNKLRFILQGSVSKVHQTRLLLEAKQSLTEMEKMPQRKYFGGSKKVDASIDQALGVTNRAGRCFQGENWGAIKNAWSEEKGL